MKTKPAKRNSLLMNIPLLPSAPTAISVDDSIGPGGDNGISASRSAGGAEPDMDTRADVSTGNTPFISGAGTSDGANRKRPYLPFSPLARWFPDSLPASSFPSFTPPSSSSAAPSLSTPPFSSSAALPLSTPTPPSTSSAAVSLSTPPSSSSGVLSHSTPLSTSSGAISLSTPQDYPTLKKRILAKWLVQSEPSRPALDVVSSKSDLNKKGFGILGSKDFKCSLKTCKFSCNSRAHLLAHEGEKHKKKMSPLYFARGPCFICHDKTTVYNRLEKYCHMAKNHFEICSSYCPSCRVCVNDLSNPQKLKKHAKSAHKRDSNWETHIYRPFQRKIDYFKMGGSIEERPADCPTGSKKFTMLERTQGLKCPLCSLKCSSDGQLENHINLCIYSFQQGGKMEAPPTSSSSPSSPPPIDKSSASPPKLAGQPTDQPTGQPTDRPPDQQTDRPPDRPANQPADRPTDQPINGRVSPAVREEQEEFAIEEKPIQNGAAKSVKFRPNSILDDFDKGFRSVVKKLTPIIEQMFQECPSLKLSFDTVALLRQTIPLSSGLPGKDDDDDNDDIDNSDDTDVSNDKIRHILCETVTINRHSDLNEVFDDLQSYSNSRLDEYLDDGSSFVLLHLPMFEAKIYKSNSLSVANILYLPKRLIDKIGLNNKYYMLIPQNRDQFCLLWLLSMWHFELEQFNFIKGKSKIGFKTHLKNKLKNVVLSDSYLRAHYTETFETLKKKCEKKVTFPVKIDQKNLATLCKCLDFGYLRLNFIAWNDTDYDFYPLFCQKMSDDSPYWKMVESCAKSNNIQKFEDLHIDILIVYVQNKQADGLTDRPTNEQSDEQADELCNEQTDEQADGSSSGGMAHCLIHLDIYRLFHFVSTTYRSKSLICRNCGGSFKLLSRLMNHTLICTRNLENCQLILPQPTYDPRTQEIHYPTIRNNSLKGSELRPFRTYFDIESGVRPPEKKASSKCGLTRSELPPVLCFAHTSFTCDVFQDDLEEVQQLKTRPFESSIEEGPDCVAKTLRTIVRNATDARDRMDRIRKLNYKISLSPEENERFKAATVCDYCGKPFEPEKGGLWAVRDHDHLRGPHAPPRGFLHSLCNQKKQYLSTNEHVVISHNGSKFDLHYVWRALVLSNRSDNPIYSKLAVTPSNLETYLTIKFSPFCSHCQMVCPVTRKIIKDREKQDARGKAWCTNCPPNLIFVDSCRYFQSSLKNMITTFSSSAQKGEISYRECFPKTYSFFERLGLTKYIDFDTLAKKGEYPYNLCTDILALVACQTYPDISLWDNKLECVSGAISHERWSNGKIVWEKIEDWLKNERPGEPMNLLWYSRIYLYQDTLFLAEIMDTLAYRYFDMYGKDITCFPSLASFSWSCFLDSLQENEIHAISDPEIWSLFRANSVGGFCDSLTARHMKANRPDMRQLPDWPKKGFSGPSPDPYDPSKNITVIFGFDAISLYPSSAVLMPCASSYFRMGTEVEVEIMEKQLISGQLHGKWTDEYAFISDDGHKMGLSLEVSCYFPEFTHDLFRDLPIFPYLKTIDPANLSVGQRKMFERLGMTSRGHGNRICADLLPREKLLLDYRYLLFFLNKGGKCTKLHNFIAYRQSTYCKKYMEQNAQNRKKATSELESKMFKYGSNVLYGKACERKEKYVNGKVVSCPVTFKKEINKFTFKKSVDFENNVSLVIHKCVRFKANTPLYLAYEILQLSKLNVARFYFNHFLPMAYYNRALSVELGYSDTDSIFGTISFPRAPSEGPQQSVEGPAKPSASDGSMAPYYQFLRDLSHITDLSVYGESHPIFTTCLDPVEKQRLLDLRATSRKCLGRWSDECLPQFGIYEMLSFRPKSYSAQFAALCPIECHHPVTGQLTNHDIKHHPTAPPQTDDKIRMKGSVSRLLPYSHKDYVNFLLGDDKYEQLYLKYNHRTIRSHSHKLFFESSQKVVTNKIINKRYLLACGLRSYPLGHYYVKIYEEAWLCVESILDKICPSIHCTCVHCVNKYSCH